MSNTHSRRWIETDKHIRQTALELLNRPEAHNLSVRLICEEAGINRTTFYEHYLDIYDLLDKLELDVMAELWDYYVQMIDRSNHLPPQPFLPLLAHIRANQDFYKNVLKTRETCRLKSVFERFLTEAVCAACRKAGVSDEKEITYYLVFFKAGFKASISKWLETGCQENMEKLSQAMCDCLPNGLARLLSSNTNT